MKNKIIFAILILSIIVLIFSGCGGGNPVTPPIDNDDSEIPEPTEELSYKIDLSIGGIIEVTDPESPINGVKLIIPPMSSNKDGKDSIATITISYLDNPYAAELPDNQGFLRTPLIISSEVILDTDCILEIPYTEDDLSNAGASSNETVNVYRYSYTSSSWEKVTINKRIHKDTGDILKIIFKPEDIDKPISSTILNSYPPSNLGLPQPGDLLYKLGSILPWEKEAKGWRPGHVGIYVGELVYDGVIFYNVIEALSGGVQRSYYNPISAFSGSATYMGARQPESITLTSFQRDSIVISAKGQVGMPYAWGQSIGILWGMLRGDLVKGNYGTFNCVGLAEKAYEIAGINNFEGLVSDWAEGNSSLCILPTCVLTPAEQYNKTVPAEGYNVSGKVSDSQGNGISGVTLNFELVSFNDYHDSFELTTNSGGYWSSDKLGREWNVTLQEDGYTFEPSSRKVKENANDVDFTGTLVTTETYTITASAGPNGSMSPSGDVTVNEGTDQSFTITPDTGYQINDVLVDGNSIGAESTYTFTNITQNHTISATFTSVAPGVIHNVTKGTYYSTIWEALDDADNDNTIEVSNGTYDESITLPFIKKIILRSVNGASSTIIRGSDDSATVTTDAVREGTVLEGFTITHKSGEKGRGIYTNGNLTIKNCIVSNNFIYPYGGGGIYNYEGSITIAGSTVSDNNASRGGGIYNYEGSITIAGSTISGNTTTLQGGGIHNRKGSLIITGATISGNSAGQDGGGIYHYDGNLTITTSIISDNYADINGGGIDNLDGSLTITKTTISDNSAKQWGGGIRNGYYAFYDLPLIITGSTISGNSAGSDGGGILGISKITTIGGSSEEEKNTICGNYKSGEVLSLDQQIRDYYEDLYDTYKNTNYISVYCD